MTVDPIVYTGRPENCADRSPVETACYDLLDELGISYRRVDHEAAYTLDDCAEMEKLLGVQICKNLVLCNRQKTAFYLLMMDWAKPFHTKDLSKQIGSSRLSFAPEEEMVRLLKVTHGSASVLALMNDPEHQVKLIMDKEVAQAEYLGCHPCMNTSSIAFPMTDLLHKVLPRFGVEPILVDLPREE